MNDAVDDVRFPVVHLFDLSVAARAGELVAGHRTNFTFDIGKREARYKMIHAGVGVNEGAHLDVRNGGVNRHLFVPAFARAFQDFSGIAFLPLRTSARCGVGNSGQSTRRFC